jgi:hypothetical protein
MFGYCFRKSSILRGSGLLIVAVLFFCAAPQAVALSSTPLSPLRLHLSPLTPAGEVCEQHSAPAASQKRGPGKRMGSRPVQESEHRPQPVRTYHFNEHRRLAQVNAYVRRPDGTVIEPKLQLGVDPKLTFPTPFGNGPVHGANNVYVVEQGVENAILQVRTAKWITMHHSCGWGHDEKFNEDLTTPQSLESIPFEIKINDLWDTNFHSKVASGQNLHITVLSFGKPVPGAVVQLETEKKWRKEVVTGSDGTAVLQMIKDYYPKSWPDFKRTRKGEFFITANYEKTESGSFRNIPYERIQYVTTHPWYYTPAQADYSSYAFGLIIASLGMVLTSGGIFLYREHRKKPAQGIVFDE